MSAKYLVFISYRRTDSIHITDRIYEHLKRPDPDFQNDMERLTNGIKSLFHWC